MAKKKRTKSASKKVDAHFFSALVGFVLGAGAFYAQRAAHSKSAAT